MLCLVSHDHTKRKEEFVLSISAGTIKPVVQFDYYVVVNVNTLDQAVPRTFFGRVYQCCRHPLSYLPQPQQLGWSRC